MADLFSIGARPQFAARHGSWDVGDGEATGVPRAAYIDTYMALPTAPASDSGSDNDTPEVTMTAAHPSITGRLRALCQAYLLMRPGRPSSGNNIRITGLIRQVLRPERRYIQPMTLNDALFLLTRLKHRMLMAVLAERYVQFLRLRPFRGFGMFTYEDWRKGISTPRLDAYKEAWKSIGLQ